MTALSVAYWQRVAEQEERYLESHIKRKQAYIARIRNKSLEAITEAEYQSAQRTEDEVKFLVSVAANTKKLREAYLQQSAAEADELVRLECENGGLKYELSRYKSSLADTMQTIESQHNDCIFLLTQLKNKLTNERT